MHSTLPFLPKPEADGPGEWFGEIAARHHRLAAGSLLQRRIRDFFPHLLELLVVLWNQQDFEDVRRLAAVRQVGADGALDLRQYQAFVAGHLPIGVDHEPDEIEDFFHLARGRLEAQIVGKRSLH